jgi:hypothetical protein
MDSTVETKPVTPSLKAGIMNNIPEMLEVPMISPQRMVLEADQSLVVFAEFSVILNRFARR